MDADADQLGEALAIMFTVTASGILVIIATEILLRTRGSIVCALLFSVLAAYRAWGLIRVKRLSFWLRRNGRSDQAFPLIPIHFSEIVSSLMLLLITLLFRIRPGRANLQGMVQMVMELLRPLARPSSVLLFQLVGLAITGYGMGVFFYGDSGVYFVTIGFLVVVITGVCRSHLDGVPLMVYVAVLLVATYIAGDWQHSDFQ